MKKELSDISETEINEFYMTISKNVKEARSAVKMSQLELSLKLGIKSYLSTQQRIKIKE